MRGIVGVVKLNNKPLPQNSHVLIEKMIDVMCYRGQAFRSIEVDTLVALGFQQFSTNGINNCYKILHNEDESISLVSSGEIFNYLSIKARLKKHLFTTSSNYEALIHLYEDNGNSFVESLDGMFSFALFDRKKSKVILARDPLGIKPLYYTYNNERLVFASEIKALFTYPDCPREFDWIAALKDPWMSGSIATNLNPPDSYFRDIHQLPAGFMLIVDLESGTIKIKRYWDFESKFNARLNITSEEFIEEYIGLLRGSVHKNLQGESEIGLLLSGGIDSVAIALFASKLEPEIHSFSLLSRSTLSNEDAIYAYECAGSLGIKNHQVIFDSERLVLTPNDWKNLLWLCETPYCGPDQIYKFALYKFAKQIQPDLKVMLTGLGSDEFNGGYSTMLAVDSDNWNSFNITLSEMVSGRLTHNMPNFLKSWAEVMPIIPFSTSFLSSYSSESNKDPYYEYVYTKYRDLQMYNCWNEDRVAAANGIENRAPFLDRRLVELCLSVPIHLRAELFWNKNILRNGLRGYLSDKFIDRQKVPFFYGKDVRYVFRMMLDLLREDHYSLIEEAFSVDNVLNILHKDSLIKNINICYEDPEHNNTEFILRIANMALLSKMVSESFDNFKHSDIIPQSLSELKLTRVREMDLEKMKKSFGNKSIELDKAKFLVPIYSEDYELVVPIGQAQTSNYIYIIFEGRIHYSISKEDNESWFNLILSIDGSTNLGDLIDKLEIDPEKIIDNLESAVDLGIIELV